MSHRSRFKLFAAITAGILSVTGVVASAVGLPAPKSAHHADAMNNGYAKHASQVGDGQPDTIAGDATPGIMQE